MVRLAIRHLLGCIDALTIYDPQKPCRNGTLIHHTGDGFSWAGWTLLFCTPLQTAAAGGGGVGGVGVGVGGVGGVGVGVGVGGVGLGVATLYIIQL